MSGEFGSYSAGYFDSQMHSAADDLAQGRDALTREWAKFFHEFVPIAEAICRSEASDSGPDYPIRETIDRIHRLKEVLHGIEYHVRIYKDVADKAVRDAVAAHKQS